MRIFYHHTTFNEVTKPIREADIYNLPIKADTLAMWFFPWRFHELQDLCKQMPNLHVISTLRCTYLKVNSLLPNAMYYLLAEGDPDPEIIMIRKMSERQLLTWWITEFDIDKRKAKVTDFKNSFEP